MSIASISTSYPSMHRPQALQANAQRTQHVQGQMTQLKSNGLPKSPLAPSGTNKAGRTMSHSVSKRLLNLHM
jgi:hypothetical protein